MKIFAKEARRLELRLPGTVRSLRIFEEVVVHLVRRICKVGKGAQVENLLLVIGFSAQASTLGIFFKQIRFRPGIQQPFWGFFGLIFPTKRIFEATVLLLKKAARCHPFLAVVRCLFHNHLRLKRSSLLNVYLNYKFEISFLTSHLFFFCLLILNIRLCHGVIIFMQ